MKTQILSVLLCAVLCLSLFHPKRCRAEHAQQDRDAIYQVALLQSLAQGHFDGVITVGELKAHGDTGIGTFDGLNGEMIVLGGAVYQAIYDGSVVIPPDSETIPFGNVSFFEPNLNLMLSGTADMAALQQRLTESLSLFGTNLFCMAKITGTFSAIKVRSEYRQEKPYRELDAALAADQTEFDYENIRGTMVGLYCPSFMGGLNSVGWHFHFITEDLTRGGPRAEGQRRQRRRLAGCDARFCAGAAHVRRGFSKHGPEPQHGRSHSPRGNGDLVRYRHRGRVNRLKVNDKHFPRSCGDMSLGRLFNYDAAAQTLEENPISGVKNTVSKDCEEIG